LCNNLFCALLCKTLTRTFSFIICLLVYVVALVVAGGFVYLYEGKTESLWLILLADIVATLVVYAFSVMFHNASLYDPYWSVAPPLIAWYWLKDNTHHIGAELMLVVIVLWAIRLTLNWARGWKGLAHEDWRYVMLRGKNPKMYWFTNLAGIHLFPTVMVFLSLLPVYFASVHLDEYLTCDSYCERKWLVVTGFAISLLATVNELVADEQMRQFKRTARPGEFIQTGLWKYSRHPNYFGEICFWLGLWVMQMAVAPQYWWTAIGFLAMLAMFLFASIPMMEEKNRKSKPGYDSYISRVSVLLPLPVK
jgi:steroid 5-alpha reductase family enzyme